MWFSSLCFLKLNSDCYDIQHRFMGVINKKNKIKKNKTSCWHTCHVLCGNAVNLFTECFGTALMTGFCNGYSPRCRFASLIHNVSVMTSNLHTLQLISVCVCVCSLKSDIRSLRCNTFSLISLTKQDNDSHETPSASLCLPCHSLHKRRHGDQSQMCSPHTAILFIQLSLTAPP